MNRDREQLKTPLVGGSSLIVIFAVLCLTVFALLGLSTVRADKRLADISTQAIEDYYAADTLAETIFAQLRAGTLPEGVEYANGVYSYTCTISDTQALVVEVSRQDGVWTVLRWQAVTTTQWTENDGLNVWAGDA